VQDIRVNNSKIRAGLLYDVENKKIVWQKEAGNAYPIASITKVMVALLAVEDVRAGRVSWEDRVKWTRTIVGRKGKKKVHSQVAVSYTLYDLFKNALIASNNEASEQMARYLGEGHLNSFIQRMNEKATALGMKKTYFSNPTGLPGATKFMDNSSSPNDLLLLALEAIKHKEIMEVTALGYADINHGRSTGKIRNHNALTIDYKGEVDGIKTGYTKRAGFCLMATTKKCDHRLISIVLGSNAPAIRNEVVKSMFNDYYASIALDRLGPYSPYRLNATQQMAINSAASEQQADESSEGVTLQTVEEPMAVVQKAATKPAVKQTAKTTSKQTEAKKYIYHTIQPGDTLYTIAQRYRYATVQNLKSLNNITNARTLKPGTKIKIPTT
jgi:D-alanyl-D-alanine carboxypeptidase (penicillin-binding protein 5/6)